MNIEQNLNTGTGVENGIVRNPVHHPVPRTTSESVDDILTAEGGEKESTPLSEMNCVYFDDLPVQRLMVGKFMGKMGFKASSVFDTGKEFTSACESVAASESLAMKKVVSVEGVKQRIEWEKMKEVDVVVTDINDTDSVTDPSGGLRRGKMALESGKIVVFVSGHVENKEVIDREFSEQYGGQYIFLAKPYELIDIQKSIQELMARRGES